MNDPDEVTLAEVNRNVLMIQKILIGNGQPGLIRDVAVNTESIKRLDYGFSTLAKQVRERPKRDGVKFGGIAGGVVSVLAAAALAVMEAMSKK